MRWIFQFGRDRFRNQEFVHQSLYKAQNLGYYKNIYEDDLIGRYFKTVTKADRYAGAKNCQQALRVLGPNADAAPGAVLPTAGKVLVTVALPSNLRSLALIARAHVQGWGLVIEDCPFTERFLQPLARRVGRRMEFTPCIGIPRMIRSAAERAVPADGLMFVTFPDRPFDSIKGSIPVKLLGQEYLLSIAEALLTRARVDRVFRMAHSLEELEHPPGGADTIRGRDLDRITTAQAAALEEAIQAVPIEYLGWASLYSRSRHYYDLVNANRRNLFLSLLRHSKQQGLSLPADAYAGFVEELERTMAKVPA